ncbi:DJ-1/PfpI family protein [Aspergillus undulatus]|uniref:DJ-1/PfpI family protein n=1 Tax=Aspergillus undulatus TaxID=1810928 RepID=UPI003CCCFF59
MSLKGSLTRALIHGLLCLYPAVAAQAQVTPPTNYGVLLFRGYELLDVFGPLEALSLVARQFDKIDLHLIAESLDPVTIAPQTAAMNSFNSTFSPTINPTHTFADAPDLDVLIVPGGMGTRAPNMTTTLDYITETYPKLQYLLTVCTGSTLVAKTGILDGKRATTNKASWDSVITNGPNVDWVPEARWVVDGNIWSSSGISAGIDATLAFIAESYGKENATLISDQMEYEWHEDSSWDPYAGRWGVKG